MPCLSKIAIKSLLLPFVVEGQCAKNYSADSCNIKDALDEGISRGILRAVGQLEYISQVAGVQGQTDRGGSLASLSAYPPNLGFPERDGRFLFPPNS